MGIAPRPSRAPSPSSPPSRRFRPGLLPLEGRRLLSAPEVASSAGDAFAPTAYEQYMLTLINQARANPAAEGQALLAKGAVKQAQADLAKLQKLCRTGCVESQQLAAAIAKGPPATTLAQKSDATQPGE